MEMFASLMKSSNRRVAMGSRLASITTADSTKLTALTRRIVASAIARAQTIASGSSRRMAMMADVSMIILVATVVVEHVRMIDDAEWLLEVCGAVAPNQ